MPEQTVTVSDLKEILRDVIREVKAPNVVEQKKLDEQARQTEIAQDNRRKQADLMIEDQKNKRFVQRACSHEHRNGDSHCVYIIEKNTPGYILCQKCQGKVRPGGAPKGYKGDDIYDTALFNRMFQKLPSNELFQ